MLRVVSSPSALQLMVSMVCFMICDGQSRGQKNDERTKEPSTVVHNTQGVPLVNFRLTSTIVESSENNTSHSPPDFRSARPQRIYRKSSHSAFKASCSSSADTHPPYYRHFDSPPPSIFIAGTNRSSQPGRQRVVAAVRVRQKECRDVVGNVRTRMRPKQAEAEDQARHDDHDDGKVKKQEVQPLERVHLLLTFLRIQQVHLVPAPQAEPSQRNESEEGAGVQAKKQGRKTNRKCSTSSLMSGEQHASNTTSSTF